jgi:hypothetical protein
VSTPETDAAVVSAEFIRREMDYHKHKFILADHARRLERERDEAREDVALCRDAIAHALDLVAEWEKDHDDDNASASARVTRRRLNEALGKAEPRLLYEKPEGQQLFALAWKALRCERDALREALREIYEAGNDFPDNDSPEACSRYASAIDRARALLDGGGK